MTEGTSRIPRNKYVLLHDGKPEKHQRDWPEYKTCKHMAEAIVTEGTERGELRRVCADPDCPVHHAKRKQQGTRADVAFRAEQDKRRREEALAQATGLRVLKAIGDAVPVRLMKRDLLFLAERLAATLDERKLAVLIRLHGIGKPKDGEQPAKLLAAFLRKGDEGTLGRLLVEAVILQSTNSQTGTATALRDAAQTYKVDVDAISVAVKQEFAAKEKAKPSKPARKPEAKAAKRPAA